MPRSIALIRLSEPPAGRGHPRHRFPPLDLMELRARLGLLGLPVQLLDAPVEEIPRRLGSAPGVALIRARTAQMEQAARLAAGLRAAGWTTLAAGEQVMHRAARPELSARWDPCWDLPLLGEAESCAGLLADLAAGAEVGELAPGYWKRLRNRRPLQADQDLPPVALMEADELARYPFPFPLRGRVVSRWGYLLSARGCPHDCRHCTTEVRKSVGRRLRRRDPRAVADQLERLVDLGAEGVIFEDDTFFCHPGHMLAICNEIVRRNIRLRWIANARPDELDEERVAAAAASGAVLLKLGIETGVPRLVELMGKSRDGERWLQQSADGVRLLNRHNVGSLGLYLIGLPGETRAESARTLTFARTLDTDYVQVQRFTPYADVDLAPPEAERIPAAALHHYGFDQPSFAGYDGATLAQLQGDFYRSFYFRPNYLLRHLRRSWRWYLRPDQLFAALARLGYLGKAGRAA